MTLRVELRLTLPEDDPVVPVVRKLLFGTERTGAALKRILYRYKEILDRTPPPNADIVGELYTVLADNPHILYTYGYSTKETVIAAIDRAPIQKPLRRRLAEYVEQLDFAGFAKLLEAVEHMSTYAGKVR